VTPASADVDGAKTAYEYTDPLDRLTKAKRGSGTSVESHIAFQYPDPKTVIALQDQAIVDDPAAIKTTLLYDGLGRLIETRLYESSSQYISTVQSYDALGRAYQKFNPSRPGDGLNYATTFTYDALGRTLQIAKPDGSSANQSYSGQFTTATDESNVQTVSQSDALGRLKKVTVSGLDTLYSYDVLDNLLQVSQAGQVRTFEYDSLKRLKKACNPESVDDGRDGTAAVSCANSPLTGNVLRYTYDAAGNLATRQDGRNITSTYTYDSGNRLVSVGYNDSNPNTPGVLRCYDGDVPNSSNSACVVAGNPIPFAVGKLTGSGNSASVSEFLAFDALGRVLSNSQQTSGTASPFIFQYTYTLAGALQSMTYPSGRTITYGHDGAGRVSGLWSPTTHYTSATTLIGYTPHGAIGQINLGNGLIEQNCFNNRLQVAAVRLAVDISANCGALSDELLLQGYGYGTPDQYGNPHNNGNVRSGSIFSWDGVSGGTKLTIGQQYGYDGFNRLTAAAETITSIVPSGPAAQPWNASFTYDVYGNRWVSSTLPLSTQTPTDGTQFSTSTNRLVKRYNGVALPTDAYDYAGNLQDHPDFGTMSYDAENRMTKFTAGSNVTTFSYDADGRRVLKSDSGTSNTVTTSAENRM
jgi:YD repeat-containing protein